MSAPGFICDSMLGRLAKNLRMLGFDALYARDTGLKLLRDTAAQQNRMLLTRRVALLKVRQPGISFVFISSNDPSKQLQEVVEACTLDTSDYRPFTICLRCNARLVPIEKNKVAARLPEYVAETVSAFTLCPSCGRVYWKGTHYRHMLQRWYEFASGGKMQ